MSHSAWSITRIGSGDETGAPPERESAVPDWNERAEPIPASELERYRDAEWALHDPEVQRTYEGQWVVAYERRIIAHGPDHARGVGR